MGPLLTRLGFGLLALICLVLAGYTGIAAVGIVVTADDRTAGLLLACAVLLLIALALLFAGINFAKRVLSGEKTWSSGISRWGAQRLIICGYFFYLVPIWGPWAQGRGFRWPPSMELVLSGLLAGSLLIFFGKKRLATLDRDAEG